MEEAEIHEKQCATAQSEITALLLALDKSANRDADLESCDDKLATAKHALEALRVSLGELKGAERDSVRKKCVAMEKVHQQQAQEIEYQKSMGVRNVLLDGASSAAQSGAADPKTSEEAYALGRSIMDEDKQGLERIQGMIANTKDVGLKTGAALVRQNDQLRKVAADLGEVDSILDRTGVLARRMLRKAGTDKYLWCIIFMVVVMIIAVIVYAAVHPGSGYNSPTDLPH